MNLIQHQASKWICCEMPCTTILFKLKNTIEIAIQENNYFLVFSAFLIKSFNIKFFLYIFCFLVFSVYGFTFIGYIYWRLGHFFAVLSSKLRTPAKFQENWIVESGLNLCCQIWTTHKNIQTEDRSWIKSFENIN